MTDNHIGRPVLSIHHRHSSHEGVAISWAKFDDNYDSNPKIRMAGRDAKNLHETSIRWSCRVKTNGRVPKPVLPELGILAQLPGNRPLQRRAADRLVDLNLWEDHGDEWYIHDFMKYAAPQRYVTPSGRHDSVTTNHAPRDPNPTQPSPVPVVSLEQLRERAIGRGVQPDTVPDRLVGLEQLAIAKGAVHWIPYVLKGFQGGTCLFDQQVSRWLEEDHEARKHADVEPPAFLQGFHLRRMEEA